MKSRKPDPITVHVGRRLRLARKAKQLSQSQVGNAIGVSFQQIQKCEKGTNRIGAARLLRLAALLEVPVTFFYENLPADLTQEVSAGLNWSAPAHPLTRLSPHHDAGAVLRLAQDYTAIKDNGIRAAVSALLRRLAAASTQAEQGHALLTVLLDTVAPQRNDQMPAPITASMHYDLVACPHRVTMDIFAGPAERDEPNPFVQLLWERGALHERQVIGCDRPPEGAYRRRRHPGDDGEGALSGLWDSLEGWYRVS